MFVIFYVCCSFRHFVGSVFSLLIAVKYYIVRRAETSLLQYGSIIMTLFMIYITNSRLCCLGSEYFGVFVSFIHGLLFIRTVKEKMFR